MKIKNNFIISVLFICYLALLTSCAERSNISKIGVEHPQWVESSIMYEVNLRQYTESGSLEDFQSSLPRLAEMGVDILWFMPIYPIGEQERKGELGSYYSIRDYKDVNSEFGTKEDFKSVVEQAHSLGMKVILDWVANHTARDHKWIDEHFDWYVKDSLGRANAPYDWTDVAELDYSNKEVWEAQLDAMRYWIEDYGIDGFRCDMAHEVPTEFWNWTFRELRNEYSDLFFLGETESADLMLSAFDAYYAWDFHHNMNKLANGTIGVEDLRNCLDTMAKKYPKTTIPLVFTSNHDENSWSGSEFERMGDAARQFAVLTYVVPGIPLIYSGQEAGNTKRLEFFKRDPIDWTADFDSKKWGELDFEQFYTLLSKMRAEHPVLSVSSSISPLEYIETSEPDKILAFKRQYNGESVVCYFNFSPESVEFEAEGKKYILSDNDYIIDFREELKVEPPCWWLGMETDLTLMIHADDIRDAEITVNSNNIKILNISSADSPNYLFVELGFNKSLKSGTYTFELKTKDDRELSFDYQILDRRDDSKTRAGFDARDVVYLLMPDRFSNGDSSNDTVEAMNEAADRTELGGRHGGDIRGIMNKLPYLADLGVTSLWSTPLLVDNEMQTSYHGYACGDYYKIDPRFGSNSLYKEMVEKAHSLGLKIIMDMVPNHCGTSHWWMKDLPFKDWTNVFEEHTFSNYAMSTHADPNASEYDRNLCVKGWFDYTMPDMNLANPYLMQYFKQNAIWWVEYADLDGIRVDTYPYTDKHNISEWTAAIMNEYPNLGIVGEAWFHSALDQSYWEGCKLDDGSFKKNRDGYTSHLPYVMDFMLQDNIHGAFKENMSVPNWGEGIRRVYNSISHDFAYEKPGNLFIFMANHDTARPAHVFGGDGVSERTLLERMKNASTLLFTVRGIPQLYTGDEIMWRSADGTSGHIQERRDFPGGWEGDSRDAFTAQGRTELENELFEHVRTILNWRKKNPDLCVGKMKHFMMGNQVNTYVYFRFAEDSSNYSMTIINNSDKAYKLDWKIFDEVFDGTTPTLTNILNNDKIVVGADLEISPMSSMILN